MAQSDAGGQYDADSALRVSQAAIGNQLGNHEFVDRLHRQVRLGDYAGKPLVVSMIFTSCHHVCPTTTKYLDGAVRAAREVLGDESFEVVTIGFDAATTRPALCGRLHRSRASRQAVGVF